MEQKSSKFSLKNIRLLVLVAVFIAVLSGGAYLYKSKQDTKTAIPAGWVEYKNEKYGFKFIYMKGWGEPRLSASDGDTGKTYTIIFTDSINGSKQVERKSSLSVRFDSLDFSKLICAVDDLSSCATTKAFTADELSARLKYKDSLIFHDDSSYAAVASQKAMNETQMTALDVSKKVELKKVNASALQLTYILHGVPLSCEKDNFSTNESTGCLKKSHYNDAETLLASFKSL